ncbi:YhcG family protein [Paraeggerthella sp. Marseille-Q4926]|uniref:PDDEXK nuclease domain-containing protein n=1 Tax=Paraeggerthella sp. Marseille-Q4926 TaxID=2866587 RepID=UPI001CE3E2CF|nr:PDDEXK nuclease domain-containing protein [Paraeggerthella sp. Marseille-Q4926]
MEQLYDSASDETVYQSVRSTLASARTKAAAAVNDAMVSAYWEIGRQIAEAQGDRAEYGKHLMKYLSERLTAEFGKGFTERNLRAMRQLYLAYPIRHTLCAELSWSHYRLIIRIEDPVRRDFYVRSAVEERWTVRQLDRQIHSFYYERLLATRAEGKDKVRQEIQQLEPPTKADDVLKDPYVLDFLELNGNSDFLETDLEQALMDKLQQFLLELGKGFSFVARQQRISADGDHYYIDLVFYHYILKCFVLIDLKTGKLTPQDIGQMDFYVRLFDDQCTRADDNPTIGIVLCANRNKTVAKYSALADGRGIFASQYVLCLPTEEELSQALETTCLLAKEDDDHTSPTAEKS